MFFNRFLRPMAFLLAASMTLAPVTFADQNQDVVLDLEEALEDFRELREDGDVEFHGSSSELRYQRAMRKVARAIRELDGDSGGGGGGENLRGRTVVFLRQHLHSAYASDAIAKLPPWVTEDDFTYLSYAAKNMHGAYVADAFGNYFLNPSKKSSRNRRGAAAKGLTEHLHSAYVTDAIRLVPSFCSQDDADFYTFLALKMHGAYVAENMAKYATNPPSSKAGNRKGSAAKVIVEKVHSAYSQACLEVLPSYVSEGDLPYIEQMVSSTHGAYLAEQLREFFGSR